MRILITGASGLVGNSLVNGFSSSNNEVIGLSRENNAEYVKFNALNNSQYVFLPVDDWPRFINEFKPEILISADWQGVLSKEKNNHLQKSNVARILGLANAAIECKCLQFITFGSQAELGSNLTNVNEEPFFTPETEYGKAKVLLYKELNKLFDGTSVSFSWARLFSVYGIEGDTSWFINDLVSTLAHNKKFKVTNGYLERNFLHIDDVFTAIECIAKSRISGIVNVANRKSIRLSDLAIFASTLLEKKSLIEIETDLNIPKRNFELNVVTSKLRNHGWTESKGISEGILELYKDFI